MYPSNSLTGNESPFSILRTPDDVEPDSSCSECGFRFDREELSRKGVCGDCAETLEHACMCDDCQLEWTQIGLPTECMLCHSDNVTTDDRFLDSIIKEKQNGKNAITFATIVLAGIFISGFLMALSIWT